MGEKEVHVLIAQHVIIKFLVCVDVKPAEILSKLCA